jgi:hypothetical protein
VNPSTDPALYATTNPLDKEKAHSFVVHTFALTAILIPMNPEIIEVAAPTSKAITVQNSPTLVSARKAITSPNSMQNTTMYPYSLKRKEFAPSEINLAR